MRVPIRTAANTSPKQIHFASLAKKVYPLWALRFFVPRIELKASTAVIRPTGPVAKQAWRTLRSDPRVKLVAWMMPRRSSQ